MVKTSKYDVKSVKNKLNRLKEVNKMLKQLNNLQENLLWKNFVSWSNEHKSDN